MAKYNRGRKYAPRRKYNKRKYVKRSFKRKSYRKRKTPGHKGFRKMATRGRFPGVNFPQIAYRKFIYEDSASIDTGILNVSVSKCYRLNALWDPDYFSILGDQAVQNYNTFFNDNMYQRNRVLGCKITVTVMNTGGSMLMCLPVAVPHREYSPIDPADLPAAPPKVNAYGYMNNGLSEADINDISIMPYGGKPMFVGPLTGGNNIKTQSFYLKPWVVQSVPRADYMNNRDYAGYTEEGKPINCPLWALQCIGVAGQQAIARVRVKIVYYAMMDMLMQNIDRYGLVNGARTQTAEPVVPAPADPNKP